MALSLRDTLIDEPAKRPRSRARLEPLPSICKVAIPGFGTVGKAVTELLCCSPSLQLRLTHIYNRNVDRKRVPWVPSQVRWTDNFAEILASDVDVIVELVGGVRPAGDWVRQALRAGKSVVTANKHLIATEGDELLELARKANQRLLYGGSVAGGVPVLCGLEQGLAGDAFPADWRSQWHVQLHPEPDAERSCQFYHSARTSTGIGIRRSRSFA